MKKTSISAKIQLPTPQNPPRPPPKAVALVAKEPEVHRAFRLLLENAADFRLVHCCSSAEKFLSEIDATPSDIALIKLDLGAIGGVECIHRLARVAPKTRTILLADQPDLAVFVRTFKVGAFSYLCLPTTTDELTRALTGALAGRPTFSIEVQELVVKRFTHGGFLPCGCGCLTEAQEKVMDAIIAGKRDKEIAMESGQATSTVCSLVHQILRKLRVKNHWEALAVYLGLSARTRGPNSRRNGEKEHGSRKAQRSAKPIASTFHPQL